MQRERVAGARGHDRVLIEDQFGVKDVLPPQRPPTDSRSTCGGLRAYLGCTLGNALPDAYLALALESGAEWITADRGFARYPRLRWHHPLRGASRVLA
jgi:hypothetical protein